METAQPAVFTPLEKAERLHREADDLFQVTRLREIFAPYGDIIFTGSYYLNLMAYPDVDMYVPKLSIPQLFQAGARLAECGLVSQVVFNKGTPEDIPGGLYLKPRMHYGNWGRPWKFDIWSVEPEIASSKTAELDHFKSLLTPSLREQILAYKNSIINAEYRTPIYSGYFIYKAFLEEGLSDFAEVTRYLVAHGIKMD